MNDTNAQSMDWLDAELQDTLDEMFENELSQPMMSVQMRQLYKDHVQNPLDRRVYYKNLLRLQMELIKLLVYGNAYCLKGAGGRMMPRLSASGASAENLLNQLGQGKSGP